jgi:hypothetical protein
VDVRSGSALRAILAGTCWTAAVIVGVVATAGFVSGGAECVQGRTSHCGGPNGTLLVIGTVVAVGLGVVGALVWKPKSRGRKPYRPWQYLE